MAGLIVTCARHFEPDACDEIEKILADLGDESAYAKATSMSGIITVQKFYHALIQKMPGQNLSASFLCRESNWQNFAS